MRYSTLLLVTFFGFPFAGLAEEAGPNGFDRSASPRDSQALNEILDLRRRMGPELSPWQNEPPRENAFAHQVQQFASQPPPMQPNQPMANGFRQAPYSETANRFPSPQPFSSPWPHAGPPAPPSNPARRLFEAAFRLESIAHDLDIAGVSDSTDAIRKVAEKLREEAREQRSDSQPAATRARTTGQAAPALPTDTEAASRRRTRSRAGGFDTPPPSQPRFPGSGRRTRGSDRDQPQPEPHARHNPDRPNAEATDGDS